jgi:membrane protease YdiL (CAAX protease family)
MPGDARSENSPERGTRRGRLGIAAVGYVVAFVTSNVAALAFVAATHGDIAKTTLGLVIFGLLGLWVGLFGTVLYVVGRSPTGSLSREMGLRAQWIDVPVGVVVGVASQLGLIELIYLPLRSHPSLHDKVTKPAKDLTDLAHGPAFVVLAVLITVGSPIVEELFFRGLVQGALADRFRPAVAIGLSALAFGLAHQELLQLPGLFAFGVVLGLLYWRTGRLGPGLVAHAAFNFTTVVALALAR